ISTSNGAKAFVRFAIGWQVASSNFQHLAISFSDCATPPLASAIDVQYVFAPGIGVARAFCPAGSIVTGGGGFVEPLPFFVFREKALRQSYPISDATGVIAFGTTAIGWQAASSDFADFVLAFAVCATPTAAPPLTAQYLSAQSVGVA